MGSGNSNDIFSVYPELLALPAGETVVISPMPGQNAAIIKWFSGGSVSIIGEPSSLGSSYAISNEYLLGTSEIVSLDIRGSIGLLAEGSTALVYLNRTKSANQ